MFGVATGWLKWTPEQAWSATIQEITVAMDAAVEWVTMTTPGAKKPEEPKPMGDLISSIIKNPNTKRVKYGASE